MIKQFLLDWGLSPAFAKYLAFFSHLSILLLASYVLLYVVRIIFAKRLIKSTQRLNLQLGEIAVKHRIFGAVAYLIVSIVLFKYAIDFLFTDFPNYRIYAGRIVRAYAVVMVLVILSRTFNGLKAYMEGVERYKDKPLNSFFQLGKIVSVIIGGIFIISILLDKSPLYLFGLLGGASVVLIFAFKDPILGFIASIQLSYNDMLHIGDWVTVEQYFADGEVTEINLTTIKVQNWDKTITTIPTYAFISGSFKNWEGMLRSGGRRIKRSMLIKSTSICFCSEEMLDRFERIELIRDYIKRQRKELDVYNATHRHDTSLKINGVHMTNIGCFRIYIERYIESNSFINTNMTYLVRQMDPTDKGLPIEVYAFSKLKELKHYEGVVSDIFDHLFAATPFFELELVQSVTSKDLGYKQP